MKQVKKLSWLPGPLVCMVIGTLISWLVHLENHGVDIIGHIPRGFPPPSLPGFTEETNWYPMLTRSLLVSVIGKFFKKILRKFL